jgi:Uma2 family endonuclease
MATAAVARRVQKAPSKPRIQKSQPRLLPMHRFSVEQYHRMIETGVLTENDRVELVEGWIVEKMPQKPPHASTGSVLEEKLAPKLPKGWIIRGQRPITLEDSEPEPDLAIVRGPQQRYRTAHPTPADIAALIEVSDSSVDFDRDVKGPTYARAGIAVYWIVNLVELQVEVYSEPSLGTAAKYQTKEIFGLKDRVALVVAGRKLGGILVRHIFS